MFHADLVRPHNSHDLEPKECLSFPSKAQISKPPGLSGIAAINMSDNHRDPAYPDDPISQPNSEEGGRGGAGIA